MHFSWSHQRRVLSCKYVWEALLRKTLCRNFAKLGDFLGFSRLEETTPPQYGFSCISLARRKTSHNNSAKAILDLSWKDLLNYNWSRPWLCTNWICCKHLSWSFGRDAARPGGPIQSCSDCIYKCPRRFSNLYTSTQATWIHTALSTQYTVPVVQVLVHIMHNLCNVHMCKWQVYNLYLHPNLDQRQEFVSLFVCLSDGTTAPLLGFFAMIGKIAINVKKHSKGSLSWGVRRISSIPFWL